MDEQKVEVLDLMKVKELLENTPYQKLKDILDEQGISKAWKPGTRKADIIANALELYKEVKDEARKDALKDQDPETPVEKDPEKAILPPVEPDSETKIIPQYAKSKLIADGLSKEVLEKNLKNIDANLKNNIPSHRAILLAKRQEIEDLLEKLKSQDD